MAIWNVTKIAPLILYGDISAMKTGATTIVTPIDKPRIKRTTIKNHTLGGKALSIARITKAAETKIMVFFLPILFDNFPPNIAPKIEPATTAELTNSAILVDNPSLVLNTVMHHLYYMYHSRRLPLMQLQ